MTRVHSGLGQSQGYSMAHLVQTQPGKVPPQGDLTVLLLVDCCHQASMVHGEKATGLVPSTVPADGQPVSKCVSEVTGQVNAAIMP